VVTFTVLLALAGLIATFGLIQDSIAAIIWGTDEPPPVAPLAASIAGAIDHAVEVQVNYVHLEREQATAAP
jgi:hypothetical protein